MLVDHAHCERKAASTALNLMYRYGSNHELLYKMSRLAREELRHFERVLDILADRKIEMRLLKPGRYARTMLSHVRTHEPARQMDTLIIGAIIEARSCERFASIAPHLDEKLNQFYLHLLKSEARHFLDYLALAKRIDEKEAIERVDFFTSIEADLICSVDEDFYFHSGIISINA